MKKNLLVMASGAILASMALVMASCGKDDDNPTPSKSEISFELEEVDVYEDEGTIEYKIVFDKPAPEDFVLTIDVGGTATNFANITAPQQAYDYKILDIEDEIEVSEGDTEATISIEFQSDYRVENAETIEIELDDVDSDLIDISNNDQLVITLVQEDGLAVRLDWGVGATPAYTDVDMDLFLWEKEGAEFQLGLASVQISFASGELVFLPTKISPDTEYAVSANYYGGTENPMDFVVKYIEIKDHVVQTAVERTGSYSLANINKWDDPDPDNPKNLQREFTFKKAGKVFSDFSEFTLPEQYSRVRSLKIDRPIKRGEDNGNSDVLPF